MNENELWWKVRLLLKNGRCCFDRGCELAVVAFTSLSSTYSLSRLSPIVSIFLIVLTTVSSIIPLECNACRSVLSSSNGFLVSSSDVARALNCDLFNKLTVLQEPVRCVSSHFHHLFGCECAIKLCSSPR